MARRYKEKVEDDSLTQCDLEDEIIEKLKNSGEGW